MTKKTRNFQQLYSLKLMDLMEGLISSPQTCRASEHSRDKKLEPGGQLLFIHGDLEGQRLHSLPKCPHTFCSLLITMTRGLEETILALLSDMGSYHIIFVFSSFICPVVQPSTLPVIYLLFNIRPDIYFLSECSLQAVLCL